MRCLITHEIATEDGFKVFAAGKDYPDVGDRQDYFEKEPKPAKKNKEVKEDDAES